MAGAKAPAGFFGRTAPLIVGLLVTVSVTVQSLRLKIQDAPTVITSLWGHFYV